MKKLLIISNRPLSTTDNNGKTLYSFFKRMPKDNIAQLYFYETLPTVQNCRYFQLSDLDVFRGKLCKKLRGREIDESCIDKNEVDYTITSKYNIKRTEKKLVLRELMWYKSWNSEQLDSWLNAVNPDIIFFMAGDCLFSYRICNYIVEKFNCDLMTYVTDDYLLPRFDESFLAKFRRRKILSLLSDCASKSDYFFTISNNMRDIYKKILCKNSTVLFNMPEIVNYDKIYSERKDNKKIILTYAGGFHYGRDETLLELTKAIEKYNRLTATEKNEKVELNIYSNINPNREVIEEINNSKATYYKGKLNKDQLKIKLCQSDILVFVESFEKKEIENTRLSFSTKIPEYLYLEKPILAIGPSEVGSMKILKQAAVCAFHKKEILPQLQELIENPRRKKECIANSRNLFRQLYKQNANSLSIIYDALGLEDEDIIK